MVKSVDRSKWSVGKFVDEHYKARVRCDDLEEKLNELKATRDEIAEDALKAFGKEGLEGAKGSLATGYISETSHPKVANRKLVDKFILKTKRTELLQNRVSKEVYDTLVAKGIKVPGIEVFVKVTFRSQKRQGGKS